MAMYPLALPKEIILKYKGESIMVITPVKRFWAYDIAGIYQKDILMRINILFYLVSFNYEIQGQSSETTI